MFTFKVRPDGADEFEVPAGTRDVLVWEKSGPNRSISKLLSDLKISDMYAICHIAARRQQLWNGTLAEFEQTCDVDAKNLLEVVDEEPDPTQLGLSAVPSSPSPSPPGSSPRSGRGKKSG